MGNPMNNNDTHGPAPACLRAAVAMNTPCPALWWLLAPCSEFEDKGRGRDGPRGGAATCDPLLDDARVSLGKRKDIPVYAMITKATIPADISLLLHAGGPGSHPASAPSTESTESTEPWSLQSKVFGSAPCGVAIVAKGDVTLYSEGEMYKGTMQTTLAWTNVLFTLPGGFSTGYPFLNEVIPDSAFHHHRQIEPAPIDLTPIIGELVRVVDAGQLWAMCNDAVPVSHPGEITLSMRLDDKEKWNGKKDE